MSRDLAPPTPWEFRLRAAFIGIAYALGFGVGFPLQRIFFGSIRPTIVEVGSRLGPHGIAIAGWTAALIAVAAWLIRWWGSSYHTAGVVMNRDLVTGSFTANGPYRYVRNPLYLGNVLLAIAIGSLGPPVSWLLVVLFNLLFVYRLIAIEERYLRQAQGAAYERYCQAVPRLLPRLTPVSGPLDAEAREADPAGGFLTEIFSLAFACAMIYVAVVVPYDELGIQYVRWIWIIIGCGVILQVALTRAARRREEAR